MKRCKAQAAMEFIMSYGWALLIVVIVIIAMAAFGLLDPDVYLPDRLELGVQGLTVIDYQMNQTHLIVMLKNGIGKNINDLNITMNVTSDSGTAIGGAAVVVLSGYINNPPQCVNPSLVDLGVGLGTTVTLACTMQFDVGTKITSNIFTSFSTVTKGTTLTHTGNGFARLKVQGDSALG